MKISLKDIQWTVDVNKLAIYNMECMRGIVHTKEYDEQMKLIQIEYDKQMKLLVEKMKACQNSN